MTYSQSQYPSLYIAGTQKGGTTSLHFLLNAQQQIYFPNKPQELHYFDIQENFLKGDKWFLSHFLDAPNNAIKAQTSPLYMYLEQVPERIHKFAPNSQFIFILRNPIDRAYSHYWNSVKYGYENLNFEDALDSEKARILKGESNKRNFSYSDRGYYTAQIQRFINLFGRDSILILTQDDLLSGPETVLRKVWNFLDLSTTPVLDDSSVHNPAKLPRSRSLQSIRPYLEKRNFTSAIRVIDKMNLKQYKYPAMKDSTRNHLKNKYESELHDLSALLNNGINYANTWR